MTEITVGKQDKLLNTDFYEATATDNITHITYFDIVVSVIFL